MYIWTILFCFLKALLLQRDSNIPTVMLNKLVQCSELEIGVVCSVNIEIHVVRSITAHSVR